MSVDPDLFGAPIIAASGGGGDTGHNAVAAWLPETGTTITVASNTDGVVAGELLEAIAPALIAGEPIPRPRRPPPKPTRPNSRRAKASTTLDSGSAFTVDRGRGRAWRSRPTAPTPWPPCSTPTTTRPRTPPPTKPPSSHSSTARPHVGREERAAIEGDLGPIEGIELAGTTVEDGELRTYVRITGDDDDELAWYALGRRRARSEPWARGRARPRLRWSPTGDGEYRQPTSTGAARRFTGLVRDDRMTVDGPAGPVDALRAA